MRILMLAELYPPVIGGLEVHVKHLSQELVRRGHEVWVATSSYPGLPERAVEHGVVVHRLRGTMHRLPFVYSDPRRSYAPPLPDPEMTLAVGRLLRELRPDVVHAHNWMIHAYLPHWRPGGPVLVRTLHQYDLVCAKWLLMHRDEPTCSGPAFAKCADCAVHQYGAVKGLGTLLGRGVMEAAERATVDMFVPVSNAVARGNQLEARGLPWRVIPNFLPDEVLVADEEHEPCIRDLPAGDFILYVGSLRRAKGIEVLLNAYRQLAGAPPLVLIGTRWPDTPASLPPNVVELNNWTHAAVMAAWDRCLFGVVPSIWEESCPTVLIEGMGSGKAVIASRIGGMVDMLEHERSGLLVPPADVTALRDAMRRLLDDPPFRQQLGETAREHSRAFRTSAVVPRVEALYNELLDRRSDRTMPRRLQGTLKT
jgi:glycosyltransferase involved in cell wall biosynthesis